MNKAIILRTLPLMAIGAVALAGCGSNDDTVVAENASLEEVAEKVAKTDTKPEPGRWESSLKFTGFEVAGMPKQAQDMMKGQMTNEQKWISCLTPEQANANNGDFFKPKDNQTCTYKTFKMGDGKLDAELTCSQAGFSQNMKMSGTYADNAYDIAMNTDGEIQGNKVTMAMAISAKRIGDCDGTEPK